eukprot:1137015-Pelagomonas_calceolata.AAC.2
MYFNIMTYINVNKNNNNNNNNNNINNINNNNNNAHRGVGYMCGSKKLIIKQGEERPGSHILKGLLLNINVYQILKRHQKKPPIRRLLFVIS